MILWLHFNNNVLSAQFVHLFAVFWGFFVLLFRCWWNLDDDLVQARLWKTRLGSIACAGNRALSTLNPLTADPLKWNLGTPWTPARLQPHGITLFLILHNSRQIYWGLCAEGNVVPEEKVLALAPTFSCSCAFSCHSCKAVFGRHAAKRLLHKHVFSCLPVLSSHTLFLPLRFWLSFLFLRCLKTDYRWCRRRVELFVSIGVRRW